MEVGNILRNFCLESTTISKAAGQEEVERERKRGNREKRVNKRGREGS